jgi:hypothetical protein
MNLTEFHNEFDIIYQNISKGGAPGLIPYEKSVILTQAAEAVAYQVLKSSPDLVANLIKVDSIVPTVSVDKLNPNSVIFALPASLALTLNEEVEDNTAQRHSITPISFQEYSLLRSRPYRYPKRRTAWRIESSAATTSTVEIIGRSGVTISKYLIRYMVLPAPIVLEDLTGTGLSVRGVVIDQNTDLIPSLHPKILEVAVQLAEQYYLDKYGQSNGSQDNQ